jgi:hypothetical protein
MKAGFPLSPEPIQGIPTLQSLIELLFHLCCCAQTQSLPASATINLLFCAAPRNVYTFLTTEANAFAPFLLEVPDVPDYTVCIKDNDRATVWATHARNKKTQADIVTMNSALPTSSLKPCHHKCVLPPSSGALASPILFSSTSSFGSSTSKVRRRPRIVR